MGLIDKFKNLFTDEEIIEEDDFLEEKPVSQKVKAKKSSEEGKLPTFMREKIEKEKQRTQSSNVNSDDEYVPDFSITRDIKTNSHKETTSFPSQKQKEMVEKPKDTSFKFPIEFEENDFPQSRTTRMQTRTQKNSPPLKNSKTEASTKSSGHRDVAASTTKKEKNKVSELYKDKKNKKEEIKFQATPIISPVYGVLEKNYRMEQLATTSDNFENHRPSKNLDFDSVRKKAYGTLADDIKENLMCENCEYLKKAKACKKKMEDREGLLYDALCDKKNNKEEKEEVVEDITLDEATENYYDYGVEYQKKEEVIKSEPEEEMPPIINHDVSQERNSKKNTIPPVKSSINLLSTLKKSMGDDDNGNNNVVEKDIDKTDELFTLIDSMYDEGKE